MCGNCNHRSRLSWCHGRGCGRTCCIHLVDMDGSRRQTSWRTLGTRTWIRLVLSRCSWPLRLRGLSVGPGGVHRLLRRLLLLLIVMMVRCGAQRRNKRACCRRWRRELAELLRRMGRVDAHSCHGGTERVSVVLRRALWLRCRWLVGVILRLHLLLLMLMRRRMGAIVRRHVHGPTTTMF